MLCGWEGNPRRKLMAAYCWVDEVLVTCGLTACTPGSVPGPTLGNDYEKPLPFLA